MRKFAAIMLALCIVLCGLLPAAAADHTYIYLRPANFENSVGSWIISSPESGALESIALKGRMDRSTSSAVCASAQITLPSDGEYYVWVRGMDHDTVPGTRHFQVALGDYLMPGKMGTHGSGNPRKDSRVCGDPAPARLRGTPRHRRLIAASDAKRRKPLPETHFSLYPCGCGAFPRSKNG